MKLAQLLLLLATFILSNVHATPHPHGHALAVQKYFMVEGQGQRNKIDIDYDVIYNIFNHAEVQNRKFVVFSIIGAYRRGKSFFLGYCLRYLYARYKSIATLKTFSGPKSDWIGQPNDPLTGFSWKSGSIADTQGILFWSDIFLYDAPNGEKIAILIMDTQGLFEPGVTSDLNARIFGLSTLISSIQVVNLNGVIQEDQLQYLEMSTQFTKLIQRKNNGTTSKLKPFQDMIFLVRDWVDEETGLGYEGGKVIWERNFVNAISDNKAAENVRKNIKNAFEKVQFYLLPHPGLVVLKKGFTGCFKQLDPEFITYLKKIIESTFEPEKLVVKKVLGKAVTGEEFKSYVLAYFKAFNSNDIPKVETIFEATALREMEKIAEKLKEEYGQAMSGDLNYNSPNVVNDYIAKHEKNKGEIISKFINTPKLADGILQINAANKLDVDIEALHKIFLKNVQTTYENEKRLLEEKAIREMEKIAEELKEEYRKKMKGDIDYRSSYIIDNFMANHEKNKGDIISNFTNTPKLANSVLQKNAKNKLDDDIEAICKILLEETKEKEKELKKLETIVENCATEYLNMRPGLDYESPNAINEFHAKLDQNLDYIIKKFETSTNFADSTLQKIAYEKLWDEINWLYSFFLKNARDYYREYIKRKEEEASRKSQISSNTVGSFLPFGIHFPL